MARHHKARPEVDLEAFFAGVVDVRTYLDRHLQDSGRRRARLGKIAADLLRPRPAPELASWLLSQLVESVGASAATLCIVGRDGWQALATIGQPRPTCERAMAELERDGRTARSVDGGLLVPLAGIDGLVGALWLEAAQPLDEASLSLVQAIADTAGVALEQGLEVGLVLAQAH